MKKFLTIVTAALMLAACTPEDEPVAAPEPAPTVTITAAPEPAPTVTVEPEPEPEALSNHVDDGEYDPLLEALADDCVAGSQDACDELYTITDLGSGYEAVGLDNGGRYRPEQYLNDGTTSPSNDEIGTLIMEMAWDTFTASEQADQCEAYHGLGASVAYDAFSEGFGPDAPSFDTFRNFYDSKC